MENYKGAGVNLSIQGEGNYSIEAGGQLLLSADATSQYQMAEVEFYLDNISVGVVLDKGGSSFQTIVDLSDEKYNFQQGFHEITIVARDRQGNVAGTFSRQLTSLVNRMNPLVNILPP